VIPTKNRPADLALTVRGVLEQTVRPQQLIVADQSVDTQSESQTKRQFERMPPAEMRLTYIHDSSITGLTAARNRALQEITSDIVLFLDDDVELQPNFIEQILHAYERFPQATGVSGIVTNYSPPSAAFKWWSRIFVRGPLHDDRQPIYWRALRLNSDAPMRVTRLGGG